MHYKIFLPACLIHKTLFLLASSPPALATVNLSGIGRGPQSLLHFFHFFQMRDFSLFGTSSAVFLFDNSLFFVTALFSVRFFFLSTLFLHTMSSFELV